MNLKQTLKLLEHKLIFAVIVKPTLEEEFEAFKVSPIENILPLIVTLEYARVLLDGKKE